jgi:hypothetical protein
MKCSVQIEMRRKVATSSTVLSTPTSRMTKRVGGGARESGPSSEQNRTALGPSGLNSDE